MSSYCVMLIFLLSFVKNNDSYKAMVEVKGEINDEKKHIEEKFINELFGWNSGS